MTVKTILGTLLVISLVLNVFLVLDYVQAGKEPDRSRSFEDRARMMAEKLELDEQQSEYFEQFLTRFNELREANAPRRDKYLQELLKPEPDEQLLKDFHVGPEALQRRLDILAMMREFIEMLRPEQRELFIQTIRDRSSSSSDTQKPSSE